MPRGAATRWLTVKVKVWPCRIFPFNIFFGGDSLTQIESSLGGLTWLVSKEGRCGARSLETQMTFPGNQLADGL